MPTPAKEAVGEPEDYNRPRKTKIVKMPQKSSATDLYSEIFPRRTTSNNRFATTQLTLKTKR
jgi:hypothetical protein